MLHERRKKLAREYHNEPRLCACDCGQLAPKTGKSGYLKYVRGHRTAGPRPMCACGCEKFVGKRRGLQWPKWLKGHHRRKHGFDPKEAKINERLLRVYGIDRKSYEHLVSNQDDKCAICRTENKGKGRIMWCIDHDHETGAVRGLLCTNCNTALGLFKDRSAIMYRAINYLRENTKCA